MWQPTWTNHYLQNATLSEEQQSSPDAVTQFESVAFLSSHDDLEGMNRSIEYDVAAITTSVVVVLTGIHFRSSPDDDITNQALCRNVALSSTSFTLYFAITACLLLLVAFPWRIKIKKLHRSLFSRCGTPLKPTCGGGSYIALASLSRVASVDAFKNLSKNLWQSLDSCSLRAALQAITRKECFVRSDYIERLSINDVAIIFRYATSVNFVGFDKSKFLAEHTRIVRSVITAMDMAVKVSRGCLKEPDKINERERTGGDINTLYFVAATRIFAEWRALRLVPQGYQRYAVGLSLAYRDVLQNLEKIERGVHKYLQHHQEREGTGHAIASPTLKQLLQFEVDLNIHKHLPKLKERSAGSGILWTKRQLHYQVATLINSLDVPECYPTAKDAAMAAYRTVYDDYHGWAVKQVFSHSFGGSPPLNILWITLDPPKDMLVSTKEKGKSKPHIPSTRSFTDPPARTPSDVSEKSREQKLEDHALLVALDNMNRKVVEKWEDMLRMFNCGTEEKKKKDNLVLSSDSHFNLLVLNQSCATLTKRDSLSTELDSTKKEVGNSNVIERSKLCTEDFVRSISPMIADLSEMIEELNMNDPTRV
jgi:hypothetical protein